MWCKLRRREGGMKRMQRVRLCRSTGLNSAGDISTPRTQRQGGFASMVLTGPVSEVTPRIQTGDSSRARGRG